MKARKILAVLWDYLLLSVGTLIYCLGWTSFLIPNGLASGGLTGLCTIIQYGTGGAIPIGVSLPAHSCSYSDGQGIRVQDHLCHSSFVPVV